MAVGPGTLPEFFPVAGVKIGIASAGIKKPGRKDIVVFELAPGARVAGIFTTNQFCAAPVVLSRRHLAQSAPRYLLINTGNANAGTGARGMADAERCCRSEEHTSELQSRPHLVCRLLLEKKKTKKQNTLQQQR